jgi:hypothetical protein
LDLRTQLCSKLYSQLEHLAESAPLREITLSDIDRREESTSRSPDPQSPDPHQASLSLSDSRQCSELRSEMGS